MADKIKAFFEKRKGGKFKGKGHKLTDTAPPPKPKPQKETVRVDPNEQAKQAGLAALARFEKKAPTSSFGNALSLKSMKAAVLSEMKTETPAKVVEKVNKNVEVLAVQGVYFKCSLIGPEILSKEEWKVRIRDFLYEQLELEKGLTSCLIIHTLNKNRDEVTHCVETLSTYLNNIVGNPDEEKYRKIRLSNKIFQDKVVKMEGSTHFLEAAGFQLQKLPFKDGEEDFFVYANDPVDVDHLEMLVDCLHSAEPVPLELDRNVQVLMPEVANRRNEFPDEFYRMTGEELRNEMETRAARTEAMMQLRTKAMREKEEQRELKKYRYTLIRVRFPDGILLQGTFNVYEKCRTIKEFVLEHLSTGGEFTLKNALGQELSAEQDDSTLLELKLVPAVLLTFVWMEPEAPANHLSEETLQFLQNV